MKRCPIVFLTAFLLFTGAGHAASSEEAASGASKPFVLIARLHALPSQSSKVIALSDAADKAVKASEPGMLLHTFDRDPDDALGFVWTEVYANSQALEFHLQNPDLIKYLEEVGPFLDVFTVELYGSVSDSAVNMLKATGTPTKHYKTELGYIRDFKQ
ncbi:antibiotic biosynthesis monooxygenase [Luminiphilus sp.]|nr:antibiotic biosynthesis monooxygenase [Luminiphilus sp.]